MAITYAPTTNFGLKDSLPTNDSDKVIRGSEFTTEFTAIQTAFSLAAPAASPTFTGTVTIPTADINGGTIDGVTIGGSSAGAITGTTGQFNTSLNVDGTVTADGLTVDGTAFVNLTSRPAGVPATAGALWSAQTETGNYGIVSRASSTDSFTYIGNTGSAATLGTSYGSSGSYLPLDLQTSDTKRISIASNGDISFYEDTGTTPKFFWDASAEALGIGTSSPAYKLDVQGGSSRFQYNAANQTAGEFYNTNATGYGVFIQGGGAASRYALNVTDYAGTSILYAGNSNNVGIGTTSPITNFTLGSGTTGVSFQSASSTFNSGKIAVIKPVEVGSGNGHLVFETYGGGAGGGERMRITSAGNVGIGTSSPVSISGYTITTLNNSASGSALYLQQAAATKGRVITTANELTIDTTAAIPLVFGTNNAERMRIDSSGNLLVGTTNPDLILTSGNHGCAIRGAIGFIAANRASDSSAAFGRTTTSGSIVEFYYNGLSKGNISTNGTTVSYNTSSDARLKENIADAEDASGLIDAIQVRQFDWIADGSHQRYGMVAQELLEVAPEAVSQGATEDDMMGVDYSKLVPMLVKEIQSLRARVAQLEGV